MSRYLPIHSNPEPVPGSTRRLIRLTAAAQYLSVSPWTLRRLVQESEIPIVRYGPSRPWLFDRSDLDRWVEKHKQTL